MTVVGRSSSHSCGWKTDMKPPDWYFGVDIHSYQLSWCINQHINRLNRLSDSVRRSQPAAPPAWSSSSCAIISQPSSRFRFRIIGNIVPEKFEKIQNPDWNGSFLSSPVPIIWSFLWSANDSLHVVDGFLFTLEYRDVHVKMAGSLMDVHSYVSMDWFKGKSTGNHGFYH